MPISDDDGIDFDKHPEIVRAVMLAYSEMLVVQLRRLSDLARSAPQITAEQALSDAATMFEKSIANTISRLGGQTNTTKH